ncbi:MAG: hypothetical protein PHU21_04020 [Elusimicrobia bacterium]|nr:hypothetical protein [Elusimicrobiota bacterium]
MGPSMLLALAAILLPAAPLGAAEAFTADACSYLADVRAVPRADCRLDSGRVSELDLAEALRRAPERKRQVDELARQLFQAASPEQIQQILAAAVLSVWLVTQPVALPADRVC